MGCAWHVAFDMDISDHDAGAGLPVQMLNVGDWQQDVTPSQNPIMPTP